MKADSKDRTERQGVHLVGMRLEAAGFALREQATSDYGIDAIAELVNEESATGRLLGIQIKSGKSYFKEVQEDSIVYRPDAAHVSYWLDHSLPVIVCLCDVEAEVAYWQRISEDTLESTGKAWKVAIPRQQMLDTNARRHLTEHVTPIVAATDFTLFKTEDLSHGLAKRYALRIVLNRPMTRPETATVVRSMTAKAAKRRYSRNEMVRGVWGDTDAHIVWTYLFASAEDEKRSVYVCRSLWVDPVLDRKWWPSTFKGEDIGDGIIIDWKPSPLAAMRGNEDGFGKEQYLDLVEPIIKGVGRAIGRISLALDMWRAHGIGEESFLATIGPDLSAIDDAYDAHARSPLAPFECEDLDKPVGGLLGVAQNIVLFHDERGRKQWRLDVRMRMTADSVKDAIKYLDAVEYEMKKTK